MPRLPGGCEWDPQLRGAISLQPGSYECPLPAAKKRANRVRALLGQAPLLTAAEQETWNPPPDPDLETAPSVVKPAHAVMCPHCHRIMRLVGSWHPGRMLLYPNRPP
jgi:hypothetical protein